MDEADKLAKDILNPGRPSEPAKPGYIVLTEELLERCRTDRGGFTAATFEALGAKWGKYGSLRGQIGKTFTETQYVEAVAGRTRHKTRGKKKTTVQDVLVEVKGRVEEILEILKPHRQVVDDIKFLLSSAPKEEKVPEGLGPTFYLTLTQEGDQKLADRVKEIKARYGIGDQQ